MIKVGICGASGYMGGEVLRVLLEHPETEAVWEQVDMTNMYQTFTEIFMD